MSKWFRWYAGTVEDGKFRYVSRNARVTLSTVIALWASLLEDASNDDHRGVVTRDANFFAAILDLDDGVAEKILAAMESAGMISVSIGAITILNWNERQFESDKEDGTNAERQRRYRAKKKAEPNNGAVPPVTPLRNGTVTAQNTDTDTDTESNTPLPPKGGPTQLDALKAFEAYNATALRCGLQQAAKLTPDRSRKIIARLREYGNDGWQRALANVERSSFLTGKNDKGWRANLDFLLQASSFGKVHDGTYGNGRHTGIDRSKMKAVNHYGIVKWVPKSPEEML